MSQRIIIRMILMNDVRQCMTYLPRKSPNGIINLISSRGLIESRLYETLRYFYGKQVCRLLQNLEFLEVRVNRINQAEWSGISVGGTCSMAASMRLGSINRPLTVNKSIVVIEDSTVTALDSNRWEAMAGVDPEYDCDRALFHRRHEIA